MEVRELEEANVDPSSSFLKRFNFFFLIGFHVSQVGLKFGM